MLIYIKEIELVFLWFGDRLVYEFVIIEFVNMEMLISFVVSFLVYIKYCWSVFIIVFFLWLCLFYVEFEKFEKIYC